MRPTADGKKPLRWREVLVLMDRSLLLEGSGTRSLCPGWEGSAIIFPARLRVLDASRSWRDGKLQPITFSAERMTRTHAHTHTPFLRQCSGHSGADWL